MCVVRCRSVLFVFVGLACSCCLTSLARCVPRSTMCDVLLLVVVWCRRWLSLFIVVLYGVVACVWLVVASCSCMSCLLCVGWPSVVVLCAC